ncbi:MAG: NHL repeat-containing protein, partial [Phycisphaerae bacterium]
MAQWRCPATSVPLLAAAAVWAALAGGSVSTALGRDADLELGGPGAGKGKFARIRDLAFDSHGRLYVLDGGPFKHRDEEVEGNFLVQKFDADGRFVGQFTVFDQGLGAGNDPARLAIDGNGQVYVTQPKAGVVQQFSGEGRLLSKYDVPDAYAVAVQTAAGRQRVLVAAQPGRGRPVAIRQLEVLAAAGLVAQPMKLTAPLVRCDDLAVDREGNIYAHAEVNQVHKFDANGRHVLTIGGGTRKRREDGSELVTCVAVDSRGNIHSMGWGGKLVRFNPGVTTVARRGGRFTWYDYWGSESILAVDPADRVWVAAGGRADGRGRYHFRPAVLRTQEDFFGKQADVDSTLLLGLSVRAVPRLPYHVAYGPGEVVVDFIVDEAVRRVRRIDVAWQARDVYGAPVAQGSFALPLTDGAEARREVRFVAPRLGWYTVEFQVASGATRLIGVGTHVGVTPKYDGMAVLTEGASKGGWEDPLRQAFCGLMLMRTHPRPGQLDKLEDVVVESRKHGVTLLAQFTGKAEAGEDFVREAVTRFKGRIRYWEIINEPNFSFSPAEYVKLCRKLHAVIKEIDPSAKVLAPAVCGVQLPWYKSFYELGGGKCCDILSVHDYEGHESVDHHHWPRKFADLRALMARHGDADKPVWQTERGIPGVRASTFLGPAQAVRVLLHRNLLASLGVPSDRSVYYYLNQGGYGAYPAYLWSDLG